MEPKFVYLEEKKVTGIGCRTSNQLEASGEGSIPKLWGEFYRRQQGNSIPNKTNECILGVYTDYETDVNGMYTMMIGSEVHTEDDVPSELIYTTLPASKYAVFTSEKGYVAEVVPQTWASIWKWFRQSNIQRAYKADFELYDESSSDPENAIVEIYISVL
ncbi:putative transcriptional regulator YdeE [Bacillus fengqiuensis]|nr:putative transcriptional regulator YdeE [Bacillus fengqiuensis]